LRYTHFRRNLLFVEYELLVWPPAPGQSEGQVAESNNSIRVEIYDETYNLRGSDPAYIQRLADVVDAKMRAVAQHTSTVDSLRVAVLAALNIVDDYYQLKRKYEGIESEYTSRAGHLGRALDSALDEVLSDERRAG